MRTLVMLGLFVVAGCEPGEPDEPCTGACELSCMEADLELSRELGRRWDDPNACASDAECIAAPRVVDCPEESNHFEACPIGVHVDSADDFEAAEADAAAVVCPRVHGCHAAPMCMRTEVRCAAFDCHAMHQIPCLTACEAMGCRECPELCLAASVCVEAATTCDAANACDPRYGGHLIWAWPVDEARGCLLPEVVVGILDEPPISGTGDVTCGVGPDGRSHWFGSGTWQHAVAFPDCAAGASYPPSCD